MSVLRLLSPKRAKHDTVHRAPPTCPISSEGAKLNSISLDIQLLTNGTVLMEPPTDPLWPHVRSNGPREDQLLNGGLDIQLPRGTKKRRVKFVSVGIRTKCRLNIPGRGWEEDVIFERKVEMMGGNSDGIVLDVGIQRFEFTLILPSSFAPHDWHHNGSITQELFAELEGRPEPPKSMSGFNIFNLTSKRDKASISSRTPSRSPSPTSVRNSPRSLSPILGAVDSMSITRQAESALPVVPSYDESQADPAGRGANEVTDDWVVGLHQASRNIQVTHNPNPTGNFSDIDLSQQGFVDELGIWELKIMSDVYSVGGPVHVRLTLPSPSPKITVYSWSTQLIQTHSIISPRDDPDVTKPTSHRSVFEIAAYGTRPPRGGEISSDNVSALWRGTEAGGTSTGSLRSEGDAFLPKHHGARPTTLPGMETPIQVSHILVAEVYFSVWGEDDRGNPMLSPGLGGLRVLRIEKPTILPSCALIPARLDVPHYAQISSDKPCPECGQLSNAQMCTTCAPTFVPHPRHDRKEIPDSDGFCVTCYKRFEPVLDPYEVELCACLLDKEKVRKRMARFWEDVAISEGAGSSHKVV